MVRPAVQYARAARRRGALSWSRRVGIALCLGLWCPPAHADNDAAAEALFVAGRELARQGDIQGACHKFRESYRLDRAAGTELNLAICEAELGHLAVAWELFRSLRGALEPDDPRVALVDRHLSELEPRLPRIMVAAAGALPSRLTVRTGSIVLSESGLGVAIPVDPGEHLIVAEAPGFASREYRLTIREGELQKLQLEPLVPLRDSAESRVSTAPPAPASHGRRARPLRTSAVLSFGVAGAALTTSLAAGLAVLDRKETMEAECGADGCSDAGMRAAQTGETLARVGNWSFAASVALAATGVVLLVLDGKRPSSSSVALSLSPGGFTLRAPIE